jgi:hypothetical protein
MKTCPFVAFKSDDNEIWVWTYSPWFEPGPIPPKPDFKNPINAVEVRVNQSSDDAEELEDVSIYLNSTDLEFMKDNYRGEQSAVGMRWTNITIPLGAIITRAYIRFTTDEIGFKPAAVRFYGEASHNAQTFTGDRYDITNRPQTGYYVDWDNIQPWQTIGESGEKQTTPDLKEIIQEIIDTDGWQSGTAWSLSQNA